MEKEKETMQDRLEMKLLSPLTGGFFLKDSRGRKRDFDGSGKLLDGRELAQYEDAIQKAVDRENRPEFEGENICDFMDEGFDGSPSIQEKVEHALVSVENVDGILYGCTTLQLKEPLEAWELQEMCKYITGQYSEGWGEGFGQRDIPVDGGILNVYFEQAEEPKFQVQGAEVKKPDPEKQNGTISQNKKMAVSETEASCPQEKTQPENEDRIEVKLLTPLAGDFFPDNNLEWEDDFEGSGEPLDGEDLAQYEDAIQEAVDRENEPEEGGTICNLMDYFHGSLLIKEKVESAVVSVERVDGILYGCTTLQLKEFLESEELHELCEYITGQYSDGWGEGFEQRDIQVDDGTLNVHFWQEGRLKFQMQTTEEKRKDFEKEKSCPQEKKHRPKMQLVGHDGNIFSIVADAGRVLSRNGQRAEADEMYDRVFKAGSYHEALGIISEYVETELSTAKDQRNKKKQKQEKKPCR